MTLIIALGNPEHTVLVADRRHSSDEVPVPGEFTKALALELADARLAVAFTGLATGAVQRQMRVADMFRTRFWLAETLSKASGPDPTLEATVAELAASASRDIIRVPVDKPDDRALTIFLAGYLYRSSQPRLVLRRVSNFEGPTFGSPRLAIPTADFAVATHEISRAEDASYVITGGFDREITNVERGELRRLH